MPARRSPSAPACFRLPTTTRRWRRRRSPWSTTWCSGRLVLGVGPGVPGDAEAIGDLGSDRNRKTQEALEHMYRIWSEAPPYRIEGEFYRTTTERSLDPSIGVGIAVRPLQKPHPPIAITSIRPDSRGPHAAGARGWTGISATYVGAYVVSAHIQSYLEGRRSAGLQPTPPAGVWRAVSSLPMTRPRHVATRIARTAPTASTSMS